jgi:hypothetical protein
VLPKFGIVSINDNGAQETTRITVCREIHSLGMFVEEETGIAVAVDQNMMTSFHRRIEFTALIVIMTDFAKAVTKNTVKDNMNISIGETNHQDITNKSRKIVKAPRIIIVVRNIIATTTTTIVTIIGIILKEMAEVHKKGTGTTMTQKTMNERNVGAHPTMEMIVMNMAEASEEEDHLHRGMVGNSITKRMTTVLKVTTASKAEITEDIVAEVQVMTAKKGDTTNGSANDIAEKKVGNESIRSIGSIDEKRRN